jgi:hypothetical protein
MTVRIDAPCLDCNGPIAVEMRDGQLLTIDSPEVIGHLNQPVAWRQRGPADDQAFR